jgi:hypothetical protein
VPYIDSVLRSKVICELEELTDAISYNATADNLNGLMTYIIYYLIKDTYWGGFDQLSDGIKVLECAKMEFYRQMMAPYEDTKKGLNGDV